MSLIEPRAAKHFQTTPPRGHETACSLILFVKRGLKTHRGFPVVVLLTVNDIEYPWRKEGLWPYVWQLFQNTLIY